MKIFRFFLRYSPRLLCAALIVGAIGGVGSAALLALINSHLNGERQLPFAVAVGSFCGLVAITLATGYVSRLIAIRLSQQVVYDLRLRLCRQFIGTPLREIEDGGGDRVFAALTQDLNNVAQALIFLPPLCINSAILLGCILYLGWLSPELLILLILYLALAVASIRIPEGRAVKFLQRSREEWDALIGHFRALTSGIKEFKLHPRRREVFLSGPLEKTSDSYRQNNFLSSRIYALSNSWSQVLYFLFIGAILYALPAFREVELSLLAGYTLTFLYMRAPIVVLLDMIPIFGRARVSLRKVEELGLKLAPELRTLPPPPAPSFESLELIGVTHRYFREREERDFILGPVDLTLRPGELVFLAGGNGSGKTTLAKILVGLYVPEGGEIRFNGTTVCGGNQEWFSQHFSVLFSDFHLFDTLLGLGKSEADLDAHAREYLTRLQLDHKVRIQDGVLSTTTLSQGQRKRLALLVAYLEDNPIYVFDEWAADQDPSFKEVFYMELLPELKARGKAVLVITHDDRYFHVADRLLKLDYGRLADGTEKGAENGPAPERRPEGLLAAL
ncbi:MAG TPA: cyclic peptide export ABC transporter [Thermoanaerobaculia bacterium]|nr:cyclic peptide export ABC transporter [Thermoanaerobaculia bacterium]